MQHVKVGDSLLYWCKILFFFEFAENLHQPCEASGSSGRFLRNILVENTDNSDLQDLEMSVEWFVLVGLNADSSSHLDAFYLCDRNLFLQVNLFDF